MKGFGKLTLGILSYVPWEYIAIGTALLLVISFLVSYMTRMLSRVVLFALPVATNAAFMSAGRGSETVYVDRQVEVEVVKEAKVQDMAGIGRLADLLAAMERRLHAAESELVAMLSEKEEAEGKLAELAAAIAEKDGKLGDLQKALAFKEMPGQGRREPKKPGGCGDG